MCPLGGLQLIWTGQRCSWGHKSFKIGMQPFPTLKKGLLMFSAGFSCLELWSGLAWEHSEIIHCFMSLDKGRYFSEVNFKLKTCLAKNF